MMACGPFLFSKRQDTLLVTERAEFDQYAEQYSDLHKKNIALSGESPDYFSEYKIRDLKKVVQKTGARSEDIFDFGSVIGYSMPFFRQYFPKSRLSYSDVSDKCLSILNNQCQEGEHTVKISDRIPLNDNSQDIVFSASVFHHIAHDMHDTWFKELLRIAKPGALLAIFEHNPLNPLTLHAVNTCPLDVNAKLIKARNLKKSIASSGWTEAKVAYKVFFPSLLAGLRPLEKHLEWCWAGAQYRVTAKKA